MLDALKGKKTHLTSAAIVVLLVLHWKGWLVLPVEAYGALFALGLMALRSGVKSEITGMFEDPENPLPPGAGKPGAN